MDVRVILDMVLKGEMSRYAASRIFGIGTSTISRWCREWAGVRGDGERERRLLEYFSSVVSRRGIGIHRCPYCRAWFKTRRGLSLHVSKIHRLKRFILER